MDSLAQGLRSSARWAWKHFRPLAGIALVAGLVLTLTSNRAAIAAIDWSIDPLTLVGAALLLAIAPLLQALTLRIALRRLGATAPAPDALRIWGRSFLLRYEPGGVVGFAYRVRRRDALGASTPQVLTATGYEQLAAVTAGAIAAVAGFLLAGATPPLAALLLFALLSAGALALRPAWLGDRLARWAARRGIAVAGPLRQRTLAAMVGINLAGWTATAAGAALLANGLLGDAAPTTFVLLGAFALSWVVGVLLPLLPAGIGPRDAVLVVGLTAVTGAGAAAVLALALRVVLFAAEVAAAGVAELAALALARRRPTEDVTPSVARGPRPPLGDARSVVVVPTYDEREALPLFIARFAPTGLDLLIVDDGSPDGTGELADQLARQRPWMHVLHRSEKDGLGMAYRAGFAWCLERGYAVIGQMDCDLFHPPERLADMRSVLDQRGADLVLGSRYLPGGGTDGWSRTRLALSKAGCAASRRALGLPFSDLSGGFKLWRADCLAAIDMDELLSAGYAFQVETTQVAYLGGARIEELPFVFSERAAGVSKMTLAISLEGLRVTLALRRHHRPGGRPSLPTAP
ncbi:MAG: polyprenol monophosphomannose synthase [Solirubrobacteraceae bacterium]